MATNLTTVNIKKEFQKELRKLSQSWGISQVEFLNNAIWYFKKTGINPQSPIFSPKEELVKLEARLNQIIKFIRQQEKEKLNPLLDELIITERRLKESLALGVDKSDFDSITKKLQFLESKLNTINRDQEKYTVLITREADTHRRKTEGKIEEVNHNQKIVIDLISLMFEAIKNRGLTGKLNQTDITNFNNAIHKV